MDQGKDPNITAEEQARAELGAVLVAAAVRETHAPQSLREAIERDRARAAAQARTRRGWLGQRLLGPAGAGVLAAALLVLGGTGVLISVNGDEGHVPPDLATVASLSLRNAGSTVPSSTGTNLNVSVEGVVFPDWESLDWPATGSRTDTVNARRVVTVFYTSSKGATLGYSIVAGDKLEDWPAGRDVMVGDGRYRVAHSGGRTTVVWTEQDHTCVINSPSTVPDDKLVKLASYQNI